MEMRTRRECSAKANAPSRSAFVERSSNQMTLVRDGLSARPTLACPKHDSGSPSRCVCTATEPGSIFTRRSFVSLSTVSAHTIPYRCRCWGTLSRCCNPSACRGFALLSTRHCDLVHCSWRYRIDAVYSVGSCSSMRAISSVPVYGSGSRSIFCANAGGMKRPPR